MLCPILCCYILCPVPSGLTLSLFSLPRQQSELRQDSRMLWVECRIVDALRGRRRMRATAVKLPCSFWFLLLFGAGGLVLFIHLQDLSEMVQQQAPGQWERDSTLFYSQFLLT